MEAIGEHSMSTLSITEHDRLTWARTVWGEARGESPSGQVAVAYVPWNRAHISGQTIGEECLKPFQFSCWNANDPNRVKMLALTLDDLPYFIALIGLIMDGEPDPSHGATFYHVVGLTPPWSHGRTPCASIGHHVFYRDIAPYRGIYG